MPRFQVKLGGVYVSESKGLMRKVIREKDGTFYWESYELKDGRPTGDSLMCSEGTMLQWADRVATPDEAARLRHREAPDTQVSRELELVELILQTVPDEQLFGEVRRRGHQVT